jgi:threonine dehydrogenase-like Zn-dependent dehydrogenase
MEPLTPEELRVLACLVEKQLTTPDSYPLTENAVVAACNQLSNRNPVVAYDNNTVRVTLTALRQRGLARVVHTPGARVAKHRHIVDEALGLSRGELALLAVLALRLRDIETVTLARQAPDGPAARIAQQVGSRFATLDERSTLGEFDAIIEATGAVEMGVPSVELLGRNGVLDFVGGSAEPISAPFTSSMMGMMVGRNLTIMGSVNANPDDWRAAVRDLSAMRQHFPGAVEALITHTYGMQDVDVAFERVPGQIKAVVDVA